MEPHLPHLPSLKSVEVGGRKELGINGVPLSALASSPEISTPSYAYDPIRIAHNYTTVRDAFVNALKDGCSEPPSLHLHFSVKANGNAAVIKQLVSLGAGMDVVHASEAMRAINCGCSPKDIVFAGAGKSKEEIDYAVSNNVGWFNVENEGEMDLIQAAAEAAGRVQSVNLRFNPDVEADTFKDIATGHGGAKFGMTVDGIERVMARVVGGQFPKVKVEGIHIHIGSQLGSTDGTSEALKRAGKLMEAHGLTQINIGGGIPVPYMESQAVGGAAPLPTPQQFVQGIIGDLRATKARNILLEPGRSILADCGFMLVKVLYVKEQGGLLIYIVDGSMSELMRPALYKSHHAIYPVEVDQFLPDNAASSGVAAQVVGPVCETTDVLGKVFTKQKLQPGDLLVVCTCGAYGYCLSSNYNQRPRPAEVMVGGGEEGWKVTRRRETWEMMACNDVE